MDKENLDLKTTVTTYQEIRDSIANGEHGFADKYFANDNYSVLLGGNALFKSMLAPHVSTRVDCVRVGIVRRGSCAPVVNNRRYPCGEGDLLFMNWGTIITEDHFSVEAQFDGIAMNETYMKHIFGDELPRAFLLPAQCFKVHLKSAELHIFCNYLETLFHLVTLMDQGIDVRNAVRTLFASALHFIETLYQKKVVPPEGFSPRRRQLNNSFMKLVVAHARQQHELEFYAQQLCITPHYLGMLVRQETGETAKAWIDRALLIAIQVELKQTHKSLKVLAGEFFFPSVSSFCKFFKRMTGSTATAYRTGGAI